MGYGQDEQSSSPGALIAVVVVLLLLAGLGILAVAGVTMFFVRAERVAVEEAHRAVAVAREEAAVAAVEAEHALGPRLRSTRPQRVAGPPDAWQTVQR